jgi:hypothetical protein
MKLPNKVTTYEESVISKFPAVLSLLEKDDYYVADLFSKTKDVIHGAKEFSDVLDCLFALGRIEFLDGGIIHYVG